MNEKREYFELRKLQEQYFGREIVRGVIRNLREHYNLVEVNVRVAGLCSVDVVRGALTTRDNRQIALTTKDLFLYWGSPIAITFVAYHLTKRGVEAIVNIPRRERREVADELIEVVKGRQDL